MLKIKRQQILLEILEKAGEIKVGELSRIFDVSVMTLHRDLEELEKQDFLKRVHGGAMALSGAQQPPFHLRKVTEIQRKNKIAREALKHIKENQIVFFDAGTTTLALAEIIPGNLRITAITTGMQTALVLAGKRNVDLVLIGGSIHESSFSSVGKQAKEIIKNIHADIAFISTKAFDDKFGTYEAVMELIEIKEEIVNNSDSVFLIADSTKSGLRSLSKAIPLERIDKIITDDGILENGGHLKYKDKIIIAQ